MRRASLIGVLAMALAAGSGFANPQHAGFGFSTSTGRSRAASPVPRCPDMDTACECIGDRRPLLYPQVAHPESL